MVTEKTIYITASDKARLQLLLNNPGGNKLRFRAVSNLADELEMAIITAPQDIPNDVITMNSSFVISDPNGGKPMNCTLVYPGSADYAAGRISIVSPLGASLLGRSVGSEVEYQAPAGTFKVRVDAILAQPEASGDYDS